MRLVLLLLIISYTVIGCTKTQESYPSRLIWDNKVYALSDEEVLSSDIGDMIGKVQKQSQPMPYNYGEFNALKEGTQLFMIKTLNSLDEIAYEKNGKFYKAKTN